MPRPGVPGDRRPGRAFFLFLAFLLVLVVLVSPAWAGGACEDRDRDGYFRQAGCGTPVDCDDGDALAHPGEEEACDGVDNDCDGETDEGCDRTCDNPRLITPLLNVSEMPDISRNPDIAWGHGSWYVAWDEQVEDNCKEVLVARVDREGTRVLARRELAGGAVPGEYHTRQMDPRVTASRDEVAVTWYWWEMDDICLNGADGANYDVSIQRLSPELEPRGDRVVLRADEDGCGWPYPGDDYWYPRIAWNGSRYGLSWLLDSPRAEYDGNRFTTIDRDNRVADRCGVVTNGEEGVSSFRSLAGQGDSFLVVGNGDPPEPDWHREIYSRRVLEDLSLPDPEPRRVTHEEHRSTSPEVTAADGGWGLVWQDDRTNTLQLWEVFFARLHGDGSIVDPPGEVRVTLGNDGTEGTSKYDPDIAWTGEQFGICYELNNSSGLEGDIYFQLVDRDGNRIGEPVLLSPSQRLLAMHCSIDWDGRGFGVVFSDWSEPDGNVEILFARVGCNCADADGDHYTSCTGRDCDDTNPMVNPAMAESCVDGVDNDCDGLADCQDAEACPAGAGEVPGEVSGVRFAGKDELAWDAEPLADVYAVVWGHLRELRARGDFGGARCGGSRIAGTSAAVPEVPIAGDGRWYLVRAKADPCRLGTLGSPQRDEAKTTCP